MKSVEPSGFKFTNPLLMGMQFSLNQDFKQVDGEAVDIPIEMEVTVPDVIDMQGRVALVMLTAKIGTIDSKSPYYISATMGANFKWNRSIPDNVVEALLSKNAPALLLGYLRPYIAQITEASPVGAVHIPFMNFIPGEDLSKH